MTLKFSDGKSFSVTIQNEVLEHLYKFTQNENGSAEAGGQLFAGYNTNELTINLATGPNQYDIRRRFFFKPDRTAENKDINRLHSEGLHFVGDWHTHPEPIPSPSQLDIQNIRDCFAKSKHSLDYFILIIIGTSPVPEGLYVGLHDNINSIKLTHCF